MIEYEEADALVRPRESEVGGRRIAAHAVPYSGEVGGTPFRFDPLERRLAERRPSGRVAVGPADPAAWERAFARCPAGPVLVGPASPVEEIRGAHVAAAEGAARSGRAVYLLDPVGLPSSSPQRAFVALFAWTPDPGAGGEEALDSMFERAFEKALEAGIPAGGLFPIVPGWTDEPELLEKYLSRLSAAGAVFAAPVPVSDDGDARRILVEARARFEPAAADRFFEKIHHSDWPASIKEGLRLFRTQAARLGLAVLPRRPVGAGEPPDNSAAAARLEERAQELEEDEHRAALLHAAARWIDESGRDLAPVVREGNFAKVFPFGALTAEAEAAFRAVRTR
ncbi:MAG: hypothetical protein DMF55_00400 [Acidobacteria bacterium]|nr:MAG: hypothetical protein DMF55_00400 [Acidobacteriota bacterium]